MTYQTRHRSKLLFLLTTQTVMRAGLTFPAREPRSPGRARGHEILADRRDRERGGEDAEQRFAADRAERKVSTEDARIHRPVWRDRRRSPKRTRAFALPFRCVMHAVSAVVVVPAIAISAACRV